MFGKKMGLALGVSLGLGICAASASAPGFAQSPQLALLRSLERGEWTIRFRDGSPEKKICVRNGRELIKIRHSARNCSQFVVDDTSKMVAVQYTCPAEGYARTTIRKETASLVQITSNGISEGLPFQFEAEGRRTGECR